MALCPPTIVNVWLGSVLESLVQAACGRCESFWAQPYREEKRSFVSAGGEEYGGSCIHPFRRTLRKVRVWALVSLLEVVWTKSLWAKALPLALTTPGGLIAFGTSMRRQPRSSSVPFMCGVVGELDVEIRNSSAGVCLSLAGLTSCGSGLSLPNLGWWSICPADPGIYTICLFLYLQWIRSHPLG